MRSIGIFRTFLLALSVASLLGGVALGASARSTSVTVRLSQDDLKLVAQALTNRAQVSLVVAAVQGQTSNVASTMTALGGTVLYRDDEIGYLRVQLPPTKAIRAAAAAGISAVSVDRKVDPELGSAPPDETGLPIPGATTPAVNAYLPTGDIGAPQFVAAHPTWDGRGTTLGVIDDGVDPLTPELGNGRLADGTVVPKLVDYSSTTSPFVDAAWVDMSSQVSTRNGSFTFAGDTYTAPALRGSYRIGSLDEQSFQFDEMDDDLNRDGNPPGSRRTFAVLWDMQAARIWVDTDQDLSFADQRGLAEFRISRMSSARTIRTRRCASPSRSLFRRTRRTSSSTSSSSSPRSTTPTFSTSASAELTVRPAMCWPPR